MKMVFLAYATYIAKALRQFDYTQIINTFERNENIITEFANSFVKRFDPNDDFSDNQLSSILETSSLTGNDLIIFQILERVMIATVRTNFFRPSSQEFIVLKLDSNIARNGSKLKFETIIYSDTVEGIHMRGDLISRGGIRWSHRENDYPVEVMGLVNAQIQKNVTIIPSGAKGCFIDKSQNSTPATGLKAYDTFIRGLLEITDNIKNGEMLFAESVKSLDGIHDSYLVVAADKGTASFSDHANNISKEYNFWLEDAFASGGSNGYDHKKIGITSLGTLVATKHHFANLNIDYNEITVIGVGGMSGDVFGNAMILLNNIRLIAAFSHSHIFIDPNPDTNKAFCERSRLFKNTLSWKDYDQSKISSGGGIFKISDASISLSQEIKNLFEITVNECSGYELVKYILKGKSDLLFFGGIGTFVKASHESNRDAFDNDRDLMRIDANQLRVKVISEGANLAMTMQSRIEAAKNGISLNTDAVDNFSGVNCSDHEVNLKILFSSLGIEERNTLIRHLETEVVQMILVENQHRNIGVLHDLILSQTELKNEYVELIKFLKSQEALSENFSSGIDLTRPEICELMSLRTHYLKKRLMNYQFPHELYDNYVNDYFPKELCENFSKLISNHLLKKHIGITTFLNLLIYSMGSVAISILIQKNFSSDFIKNIEKIAKIEEIVNMNIDSKNLFCLFVLVMYYNLRTSFLNKKLEQNKTLVGRVKEKSGIIYSTQKLILDILTDVIEGTITIEEGESKLKNFDIIV
ncbi:NAD-glutamate dehydrogenase domain-containing protein [Candidatus Gromoviella agglomerans]|uniref:NAD-glutamate dehydrogenase domain-containing protein n=1 Tax=Candidatus Gromoviella agglomerans TaxID=2806609 RepID=UPI001E30CC32|nr:NAD-glutamate dehydrogenase domain-containing protein [Candidatus Gromoviella agglomerans]